MRIRLDPANLHENGKAATFVPLVAGGSGEGYWNVGAMARYVFTTSATRARVRTFSTEALRINGIPQTNTLIPYRVNGENRHAAQAALGDNWYAMHLGVYPGVSAIGKRIELFVPIQNATVYGQAPQGVYPVEIEFDGDATLVAPATNGKHWVIISDSLGLMWPRTVLESIVGLAKMGTSDQYHRLYAGAYNAGTTYLPAQRSGDMGQIVAYTDPATSDIFTWEKTSAAGAGTTPAPGADWRRRGFVGRVTFVGWGTRRWIDDLGSSGATAPAFAATIAALGPTRITALRGTNDHNANVAVASVQAGITAWLNALPGTYRVNLLGTLLTDLFEGPNGVGETLDQMRAAVGAAQAATTRSGVTYSNLKSLVALTDMVDNLHPGTAGARQLYEAIAP